MEAARPIEEIIANRAWRRRLWPFPYVVAEDVFVPEVAAELDEAVRKVMAGEDMKHMGWYDATSSSFSPGIDWPLRLFTSPGWRALVSGVLGVETAPYVSASVHHHAIASKSGSPHNDLNPVYFAVVDPVDGIVTMDVGRVNAKSGEVRVPGTGVTRKVRAISLIYYIANDVWHPGDGGETGLYEHSGLPAWQPTVAVPPRNNSLVAFECTPNSYHCFISNRVAERNSITMWFHRSDESAVAEWGEHTFERWPESPPPPAAD